MTFSKSLLQLILYFDRSSFYIFLLVRPFVSSFVRSLTRLFTTYKSTIEKELPCACVSVQKNLAQKSPNIQKHSTWETAK